VKRERLLLALDFGGTKLTAGLAVSGEHRWRARRQVFSSADANTNRDLNTMMSLVCDLLGGTAPAAIGVSFGGPVRAAEGVVLLSHHVPGWENFPLREHLERRFGAPAAVDNDANVAALGEWRFGAGQGCRSLLYVTVSTGIGGGWVLDGRIYHGADSLAGEIGHMTVQPGGPVCACGRRGCLEAVAAGPAIARRARERLLTAQTSEVSEDFGSLAGEPRQFYTTPGALLRQLVGGDVGTVTAQYVSQAAEAGDELAQQVLEEAAHALGFGIGCAIVLMNPERVVVGGGVAKSGERYFQVVRAVARANVLQGMRVDIVPAELADDAPLWGAVALAEGLLPPGGGDDH
jgi:glucokinase